MGSTWTKQSDFFSLLSKCHVAMDTIHKYHCRIKSYSVCNLYILSCINKSCQHQLIPPRLSTEAASSRTLQLFRPRLFLLIAQNSCKLERNKFMRLLICVSYYETSSRGRILRWAGVGVPSLHRSYQILNTICLTHSLAANTFPPTKWISGRARSKHVLRVSLFCEAFNIPSEVGRILTDELERIWKEGVVT
jgi:hypothetical protein